MKSMLERMNESCLDIGRIALIFLSMILAGHGDAVSIAGAAIILSGVFLNEAATEARKELHLHYRSVADGAMFSLITNFGTMALCMIAGLFFITQSHWAATTLALVLEYIAFAAASFVGEAVRVLEAAKHVPKEPEHAEVPAT